MADDGFQDALLRSFGDLRARVTTETGDWSVKGFIDIHRRIYAITLDTKVLSKVLELLLFPVIAQFAHENDYEMILARAQNQYPDISFLSRKDDLCFALDIKSTYRKGIDQQGRMRVNGMTLGTFGGYFRSRDSASISTFPYNRYARHYVLGVIYDQVPGIDERQVHTITIDQLDQIPSVASQFEFFLHEKYRIASDRTGSGNTRNIGSTVFLDRLMAGRGVCADLGVEIFDDYWMNYRSRAMAKAEGFAAPPYSNLLEYKRFKEQGAAILTVAEAWIQTEVDENEAEA